MIYLALAAASFIFVFLKAFQQRNVAFNHYLAVLPTSLGMAATEVFVVVNVAATGWSVAVVLSVGLSAGLGAIGAMLLHNKLFPRKDDE